MSPVWKFPPQCCQATWPAHARPITQFRKVPVQFPEPTITHSWASKKRSNLPFPGHNIRLSPAPGCLTSRWRSCWCSPCSRRCWRWNCHWHCRPWNRPPRRPSSRWRRPCLERASGRRRGRRAPQSPKVTTLCMLVGTSKLRNIVIDSLCTERGGSSFARFWRQEFGEFPRLVGRYSSYLLPKQAGGTTQILVFKTLRMTCRPALYVKIQYIQIR